MDSKASLEPAVLSSAMTQPDSMARWASLWLADWLPALPLLVVAYGLLVAPVVALLFQSVLSDDGQLTLANWIEVLTSKGDRRAIITSLKLGFVSATSSMVIGGPIAWFISRMLPVSQAAWLALLNMATNFSGIGLAFGFVSLLGTYGMVTLAFQELGVPFVPPTPGSFWGLVLAYNYTNIPLFVLLTIAGMGILRHSWWEAAQTCGATPLTTLWRIVLPNISAGIATGSMLVFAVSFNEFALVQILVGARYETISLYSLDLLTGANADFNRLAVITCFTFLIVFLISAGSVSLNGGKSQTTPLMADDKSTK